MALYGGIAVVGYGLHDLSPAHQHGSATGQVHAHATCTHHHSHSHAPVPDRPGWSDAHECDICILLDQLRSDAPQLAAVDHWQPLIAVVAPVPALRISAFPLGLHVPRGPPALAS